VGERDEWLLPCPALVMPDLFQDPRREVAERFELVVHGKAHREGGLQGARDEAGEHQIEGADLPADRSRQRDAFGGKVRALAASLPFLRVGVASNFDGAHGADERGRTMKASSRGGRVSYVSGKADVVPRSATVSRSARPRSPRGKRLDGSMVCPAS